MNAFYDINVLKAITNSTHNSDRDTESFTSEINNRFHTYILSILRILVSQLTAGRLFVSF